MKNKFILASLIFLGLEISAQSNNKYKVGINTDSPNATLTVKSKTGNDQNTKNLELENANAKKLVTVLDNGNVGIGKEAPAATLDIQTDNNNEVLRFSTKPSALDVSTTDTDKYVFFVGKDVDNGYNTRVTSLKDIISALSVEVPFLRRIVLTNTTGHTFTKDEANKNTVIKMDDLVSNTSTDDYEFNSTNGSIKILKDGEYEIDAWVGFKKLTPGERDILLTILKGNSEYKSTVVSRISNKLKYSVGNGVGSSFTFIDTFKKGDVLQLSVNPLNLPNEANYGSDDDDNAPLQTLPNSCNFSISRVTKDGTNININN